MSNFYRYFEFASKNSLNSQELLDVETFFKNIGLNFIFSIDSVKKSFGRVTGLKYETGGGYNYERGRATFIFCGYRGPKPKELVEEIEELLRSYDTKEIFEWLKEKKYIFCVEYFMSIQGPSGDTFNLAFSNRGDKNDKLNLYELNLLLSKIFKIYLIDDAFKVSNIFKTDIVGVMGNSKKNSPGARNILYKKFLTRYLNELPGKPYRLFHREKITDQKPKNLLRKKGKNISIEDSIATKRGLVIVPKKIYLRKILQNEVVGRFVEILETIDRETNYNIENKKICINFINDKVTQKEAENELKNVNVKQIIDYCLQAKKDKKEIDDILSKQRKKISFNKFINQYINLNNQNDFSGNFNNKILSPSRSKELMFRHERDMDDIILISNFIKNKDIKFDKMGEITLQKIVTRIKLVNNKALDLKEKNEKEYKINLKKDKELYTMTDELKKNKKEIYECVMVINACDSLIRNFFTEKNIKKYSYNSLKKMVTDIYRSNLFNSHEIKKFLFENRIVKNYFELYLFFN